MQLTLKQRPLLFLLLLFLFRLINALLVTNLLFPDEWWQFGEVAYATLHPDCESSYLTWDWRARIRSYIFPLPLIALLRCAKDSDRLVQLAPKIVMSLWMCVTDFYTVKLAGKYFGSVSELYALLFTITSSFHASRSLRGLSNNAEMACTAAALFHWPLFLSTDKTKRPFPLVALLLVGFACLIRITALQFWLFPLVTLLPRLSWPDRLLRLPATVFAVISLGGAVDSFFYGCFTVSWWNFLQWNIVNGVSSHYGRESPLYHLSRSLPLMLNTNVFYWLIGIVSGKRNFWLLSTGAIYVLLSSLQGHKETRFLAPLTPLLVAFTARGAQQLDVLTLKSSRLIRSLVRLALFAVIASQLPIAWFYARVHFAGAYQIVDKLRTRIDSSGARSAFFLTPCHVTPYMGYLNRPQVHLDFVKCHPRQVDSVMPPEDSKSRDEFNFHALLGKFDLFVLFEGHLAQYAQEFKNYNYVECERSINSSSLSFGSNKHRGDLLIYCRSLPKFK